MFKNPDPKRYVIRIRRGNPILVDRQILRWRKARAKARAEAYAKTLHNAPELVISDDLPSPAPTPAKISNIFE